MQGQEAEELLAPRAVLTRDRARQRQAEAGVHHPVPAVEFDIQAHVAAGVLLGVDPSQAAAHPQAEALEHPGHELDVLEAVSTGALVQHAAGDDLQTDTRVPAQQHIEIAEGEGRDMAAMDALEQIQARRAGLDTHPLEIRSEEHTSELQSRGQLVCRLLLEKKKRDKGRNSKVFDLIEHESATTLPAANEFSTKVVDKTAGGDG